MSFCEKCGAYIPMDETACPACGYDPEQERRQREEQEARRREQEQKTSREKYRYAGAQQQEYSYGTGQQNRQQNTYEQHREERKTSGTGTANKNWQWNGGKPPLWEDPNRPKSDYDAYAQKAREWAADSVNNRYLSVLSYLGPLFLVPLFLRKNDAFARHHANQGLVLFLFNALLTLIDEFVIFGGVIHLAGGIFALVCVIRGILSVVNGRMDKLPLLGDIRLLK